MGIGDGIKVMTAAEAEKYALEYMKKLVGDKKTANPGDIAKAKSVVHADKDAGFVESYFYREVGKFLEDFAKYEGAFIKQNSNLLTLKNLEQLSKEIVLNGDKDKDGKITLGEAKTFMHGINPRTELQNIAKSGQKKDDNLASR